MKKPYFLIFLIAFLGAAIAHAEKRNISSYHPSPFGVFNQLRLVPQNTFSNPVTCNAGNEGLIFFDSVQNKLMTCGSTGNRLVATWEQEGQVIYPADSSQNIFVGIGDRTPDALLEISASGLNFPYLYLSSDDDNNGDILIAGIDGRIGLASVTPEFRLTLDADKVALATADGGIISYGGLGSGDTYSLGDAPLQHPHLLWYPRNASFYAMQQFDAGKNFNQHNYGFGYNSFSEGYGSFASGYNTQANFLNSFASGHNTDAGNDYTFASGLLTTASGDYSVATGESTIASGFASVAMGYSTTASGASSVAFGGSSTASGDYSFVTGESTIASGIASMASGLQSIASGDYSVAMGNNAQASGEASMAFGINTTSSGENAFSSGSNTLASGNYSFAVGVNVEAHSYAETVLGLNNAVLPGMTANSWVSTDPLFVIGNGTLSTARKNALTILKNGNVAINAFDPGIYRLKVVGGDASVDVGHSWDTASDMRLKKNITPLKNVLDKVQKLQGVKYHVLNEAATAPYHIGLIAQNVEKQFPSLVSTDTSTPSQYKSLGYGRLVPILLESVKELLGENERLETQLAEIEEKIMILKKLKAENSKQLNLEQAQ